MKATLGKTIKKTVYTLIFLFFISVIITNEVTAQNPLTLTGVLVQVAQEQQQLVVKPDTSTKEVAFQWNKESLFLVNRQPVSVEIFTKRAKGNQVEVIIVPRAQQEGIKVIQQCSYVQTTF